MREVDCETLFRVGDIVDVWQLKRSWYWPRSHNDVVQKLMRKARKGTRVVFIPGNHDEFARRYVTHNFGVIQCARWLAYFGDRAYVFVLKLNRFLNLARGRLGLPHWSLSRHLKFKVKRAVSYVDDIEVEVAREACKRGADGVVCGHIHHAEMRMVEGVLYCNDGDWVESLTTLVEHHDGRLQIIDRCVHRSWVAVAAARPTVSIPAADLAPVFEEALR